ncbi:hypothetical protein N9C27_05935 [Luminiphilus sp.]|jgi:hypothetical protein|nr:hypothetical protein [Luminiphilus sp.]MDA8826708.1 hypothetical protein [Luminiphilus sp.]MDA9848395.1 hypothetical protein [Luminiphilus sp.]MDB2376968.1 hypothetical protein [Luminiphilus sp.]MDB2616050.1 hypothetical protein [Luminiphilus sp.]
MYPKVLLALSGIIFLAYGIVCWVDPEIPAQQAGLFIATHNGYAEMAAMYGGLQGSFGAILIASAFIKGYVRPGLWLILICIGTLAAARGSVALSDLDSSFQVANSSLGIDMSSSFTAYTWGALAFEVFIAIWAGISLLKTR